MGGTRSISLLNLLTVNVVCSEGYSPSVGIFARGKQHTDGSPEQNRDRSQGMGFTSDCSRSTLSAMGKASFRSICVQTECQAPQLLLPISGRGSSFSPGRVHGVMGEDDGLCLPPPKGLIPLVLRKVYQDHIPFLILIAPCVANQCYFRLRKNFQGS